MTEMKFMNDFLELFINDLDEDDELESRRLDSTEARKRSDYDEGFGTGNTTRVQQSYNVCT